MREIEGNIDATRRRRIAQGRERASLRAEETKARGTLESYENSLRTLVDRIRELQRDRGETMRRIDEALDNDNDESSDSGGNGLAALRRRAGELERRVNELRESYGVMQRDYVSSDDLNAMLVKATERYQVNQGQLRHSMYALENEIVRDVSAKFDGKSDRRGDDDDDDDDAIVVEETETLLARQFLNSVYPAYKSRLEIFPGKTRLVSPPPSQSSQSSSSIVNYNDAFLFLPDEAATKISVHYGTKLVQSRLIDPTYYRWSQGANMNNDDIQLWLYVMFVFRYRILFGDAFTDVMSRLVESSSSSGLLLHESLRLSDFPEAIRENRGFQLDLERFRESGSYSRDDDDDNTRQSEYAGRRVYEKILDYVIRWDRFGEREIEALRKGEVGLIVGSADGTKLVTTMP